LGIFEIMDLALARKTFGPRSAANGDVLFGDFFA
jgi:hypothetical protein